MKLPEKIIVIDLECHADEGDSQKDWEDSKHPPSVIQFAAVLWNTQLYKKERVFKCYINPGFPLSDYIQKLTGITQQEINEHGIYFKDFLIDFKEWYDGVECQEEIPILSFDKIERTSIFDLDKLLKNCILEQIPLPFKESSFYNINKIFHKHGYIIEQSGQAPLAFGIAFRGSHDAGNDVNALLIALQALIERHGRPELEG